MTQKKHAPSTSLYQIFANQVVVVGVGAVISAALMNLIFTMKDVKALGDLVVLPFLRRRPPDI